MLRGNLCYTTLTKPTAVPPDTNIYKKKKNIDIYTLSLTPVASTVWDLNLLALDKKIVLMP